MQLQGNEDTIKFDIIEEIIDRFLEHPLVYSPSVNGEGIIKRLEPNFMIVIKNFHENDNSGKCSTLTNRIFKNFFHEVFICCGMSVRL